jgi:hypothetical protein
MTLEEAMSTPYRPEPAVLALVNAQTGEATLCSGTFDNFCYPPAWSARGDVLAFGAPFDKKHLYFVHVDDGELHPVPFKGKLPMPLLDVALLPTV